MDRTLAPHIKASLLSVRDWRGYRNPWMPEGGACSLVWAQQCRGIWGGLLGCKGHVPWFVFLKVHPPCDLLCAADAP